MIVNPIVEWRDFYVMIGTAAGAILGATFVVATLAGSLEKREIGIRGFITPSAVHIGVVLVGSGVIAAPSIPSGFFDLIFALGGLAGFIYCGIVVRRIWGFKLDVDDVLFYIVSPMASYLGFVAAAAWDWRYGDGQTPLRILALAFVILLIAGMRNTWDMATFMITRSSNSQQ